MKALDLFTGAGGLALGLSKAGFDQAVLVEWDSYACATILENVDRRIPNTDKWQLLKCNVADVDYSTTTDEIDLLSAGVPCQPFSVAGKGRAHQDRRDMFCEVVRAARDLKPKAILIENVKGLLRPRFRDYLDYLLLAIASPSLAWVHREDWEHRLGILSGKLPAGAAKDERYTVYVHGVNAADFGVPQWRERVFIVAFSQRFGGELVVVSPDSPPRQSSLDSMEDRRVLATAWFGGPPRSAHDPTCGTTLDGSPQGRRMGRSRTVTVGHGTRCYLWPSCTANERTRRSAKPCLKAWGTNLLAS